MDVRAIRNAEDHAGAVRRIAELWGAAEGSPEGDELDILATLVERYEERLMPPATVTPLGVLKFVMEQNGFEQTDLAALLGSRSRASEILKGRRELSLPQIRLLHSRWRIPADLLIGELQGAD
jgi:HTH-type transcriptional regulator/antitoxin HigA